MSVGGVQMATNDFHKSSHKRRANSIQMQKQRAEFQPTKTAINTPNCRSTKTAHSSTQLSRENRLADYGDRLT